MPGELDKIGPFLLAALLVFVVYRRLRRTFGKQLLQSGRMIFRIVLFLIIGCVLAPAALRSVPLLSAAVAGVAIGVALAVFGAARTRIVRTDGKLYFIPHTATGIAVSLLFLGRLAYRFIQGSMGIPGSGGYTAASDQPFAAGFVIRSPLTLGMYFLLMGYYVCYYLAVLRKSKRPVKDDLGSQPAQTPNETRVVTPTSDG